MSPRIRMVFSAWETAPEDSTWERITAAWEVLYTLITEAFETDHLEKS